MDLDFGINHISQKFHQVKQETDFLNLAWKRNRRHIEFNSWMFFTHCPHFGTCPDVPTYQTSFLEWDCGILELVV